MSAASSAAWVCVTANAPWSGRSTHQSIIFDEKMWVIGGTAGGQDLDDVWCSADGVNWTRVALHAGWPARGRHRCLVFDGEMWVLGGSSQGAVTMNDVWRSSDGSNWVQVTAHAAWTPRDFFGAVVYKDRMWVLGGYGDDGYVWSSVDGSNWVQVASTPAWGNKTSFGITEHAGKIWIMGGQFFGTFNNEVWNTSDGSNWTLVTRNAEWSKRSEFGLCNADEKMWLFSGNRGAADVWNSSDGSNWFLVQANAPWGVRANFGALAFQNGLWIIGRADSADVWYTPLASDSPTGMIAYWSMDTAGSTVADETGNGHNGQVNGATWRSDGLKGGCYEFDGINDYIIVPHHADLNPDAITISLWAKGDPSLAGQYCRMMGKIKNSVDQGWELYMNQHIGWRICPSYETDCVYVGTPYAAQWIHIAVTLAGRTAIMYTNGVEAARNTLSSNFSLGCNEPLYLGTYLALGQTFYRGLLDEVKIWGRALSAGEIAAEAQHEHENQPPYITVTPAEQVVRVGREARLSLAYGDPDGAVTLETISMPAGAHMLSNSTLVTWTPEAETVGTNLFSFRVIDSGVPVLTASASARVIVQAAAPTGMIAYWSMDTAGSTVADETGNGHNGQVNGATWRSDGIKGGSYEFDGINDYIVVPHHSDLNPDAITISLWAKGDPSLAGQYCRMMGKIKNSVDQGWELYMNQHIGWRICPSYETDCVYAGTPYAAEWIHIAVTLAGRTAIMYTNGVEAGRKTLSTSFALGCNEPLYLGTYLALGQTFYRGLLDEVKIWGRALSADEIAAEAARNLPPFVTVTPTQQVVAVGQVAALAVAYGDPDGTAELAINGLPATAIVNSNKTSVAWTPGAGDVGEHTIEFVVTDNELLSATASAVIIVTQRADRLEIVTRMLPNGTVNASYRAVLQAAGGARPYVWSVTDGALPEGIAMDANGVIAGQTAVAGLYEFMARVTDGNDQFVERWFRFAIEGGTATAVRILTSALPDAVLGEPYAVVLRASGGAPPYAWAVEDGALPGGLDLDPASGAISGTALAAANASFIVKVTDQNGGTDRKPLVIRVRPADDYNLEISAVSRAQFMINWRKHIKGDDDVDNIWVRLMFAVPDGLLLEPALPVTLFFGAYPIDGANALVTPNGRRATYYQGDVSQGDLPVVKMIVQFKKIGGADVGVVYAMVKYADLDGALGALNETVVDGRVTVPVHLLLGAHEGCTSIEMRYDSKKDKKGKGSYPVEE